MNCKRLVHGASGLPDGREEQVFVAAIAVWLIASF
jgi:hypothetical protein